MFSSYWSTAEDEDRIFRVYVVNLPISIYTRIFKGKLGQYTSVTSSLLAVSLDSTHISQSNSCLSGTENHCGAVYAEGRDDALPMLALTSLPRLRRMVVGFGHMIVAVVRKPGR